MMICDLGFIHDLDDLGVITGYSRTPRVEGETNSQGCRSVQRFIMARIHIDMLNKAHTHKKKNNNSHRCHKHVGSLNVNQLQENVNTTYTGLGQYQKPTSKLDKFASGLGISPNMSNGATRKEP